MPSERAALVNNAGIFIAKPFVDYSPEDFRRLSATSLDGFVYITQLTARRMLAQAVEEARPIECAPQERRMMTKVT